MPVAKEEYLVPKHNYRVVALEYASVIASSSSNANFLKTWVCTIYLAYASTSRNSSNIFNLVIRNCIFCISWKMKDHLCLVVVFVLMMESNGGWRTLSSLDFKLGFGGATWVPNSTTFIIQETHQICSTSFAGIELHLHVSFHPHNGSLAHYFASNLKRHLTLHLH